MTPDSSGKFIKMILKNGHESVLEHTLATVRFIVDRGIMAELTRHRIASFSVTSTRYVNYSGYNNMEFIEPYAIFDVGSPAIPVWAKACSDAEDRYNELIELGCSPQAARSVLPNSLKTEVIMSANYMEWRHIFKLRTSPRAHPQMTELMIPLLEKFKEKVPVVFDDIEV
jgi:thymidylate synthase (FAD)